MTKFAPQKATKSIASGNLTFDERVVVHHVVWSLSSLFLSLSLSLALRACAGTERSYATLAHLRVEGTGCTVEG